jgi:hypothetical protein
MRKRGADIVMCLIPIDKFLMLKICIYNFQGHKMRKTPERFKALSGVHKYSALVQLHEKAITHRGASI